MKTDGRAGELASALPAAILTPSAEPPTLARKEQMVQPTSAWQNKDLATTFLEGVRGAIPGADLQLQTP